MIKTLVKSVKTITRRIDAYFDWVEEENWRIKFPFGINIRRNHDKDISKKCKNNYQMSFKKNKKKNKKSHYFLVRVVSKNA